MSDYTEQARAMLFVSGALYDLTAIELVAALLEQQAQMREALRSLLADAEDVRLIMLREAGIGVVDENVLHAARAALAIGSAA